MLGHVKFAMPIRHLDVEGYGQLTRLSPEVRLEIGTQNWEWSVRQWHLKARDWDHLGRVCEEKEAKRLRLNTKTRSFLEIEKNPQRKLRAVSKAGRSKGRGCDVLQPSEKSYLATWRTPTVSIILGNPSVGQEQKLFETCNEGVCPKCVLYVTFPTQPPFHNSINLIYPPPPPPKKMRIKKTKWKICWVFKVFQNQTMVGFPCPTFVAIFSSPFLSTSFSEPICQTSFKRQSPLGLNFLKGFKITKELQKCNNLEEKNETSRYSSPM